MRRPTFLIPVKLYLSPIFGLWLILLAGCDTTPEVSEENGWAQEIAWEGGLKLGGCAIGDLRPDLPGQEVAVVASDGRIVILNRENGVWKQETAATLPGEVIQCAAGDLMPQHPGDELVAVGAKEGGEDDGGPGVAFALSYDPGEGGSPGKWTERPILADPKLVHAVCIGDLDPSRPGAEVLVAGYSRQAFVFAAENGGFKPLGSVSLRGEAKGAAATSTGAAIANANGTVELVERKGSTWTATALADYSVPQARIAARGADILVCANDGGLRLLRDGETQLIFQSPDRLRGAVFLDFDSRGKGPEIATAGYDGRITVHFREDAGWGFREVGRDDDRFHHLAAGELPDLGFALVGCGYSGRVTVTFPNESSPDSP